MGWGGGGGLTLFDQKTGGGGGGRGGVCLFLAIKPEPEKISNNFLLMARNLHNIL